MWRREKRALNKQKRKYNEDLESILRELAKKYSREEIAAKLSISYTYVCTKLSEYGIFVERKTRGICAIDTYDEIAMLSQEGVRPIDIAKKIGFSRQYVSQILQSLGYVGTGTGGGGVVARRILEFYDGKMSVKELAEKANTSSVYVRRVLKNQNSKMGV